MRRVRRNTTAVPEVLFSEEVAAAKEELRAHYNLPEIERFRRRPPLNPKIWTARGVTAALASVFWSKCAYCETPLDDELGGEVTHHRPTSGAAGLSEDEGGAASPDHYGWLAYEWNNLFLCCAQCNRSKRNLFPVLGPRARVRCTWGEAEQAELALLLNPCRGDPRKHISFGTTGEAVARTDTGEATIQVLSLNRQTLVQDRASRFRHCMHVLRDIRQGIIREDALQKELAEDMPFVGAARSAIYDLLLKFSKAENLIPPTIRNLVSDATRISMTVSTAQWDRLLRVAEGEEEFFLDVQDAMRSEMEAISRLPSVGAIRNEPRTSQLRRVVIRNFKGIRELDLDIPAVPQGEIGTPCMMLLGENSTGKSSTLQAIALALMGRKQRKALKLEGEVFLPREAAGWELDESARPEVTLEFDSGDPIRLQIDPASRGFLGAIDAEVMVSAYGSRRFFDEDFRKPQAASNLKSLFYPFAKIQHPGEWLEGLSHRQFDAVARAIRPVLALRTEDHIGRDAAGRLFVQAHGRETPLERLSDGYRSLMAMTLDIMRSTLHHWGDFESARGIVLIDELETHLHPRWKLQVVTALRDAMPNVQFIATTHDPLCLRGMRNGEVQVLQRQDNHTIHALAGLPDVRGLRAEQLLTSEFFGLSSTSDPDVEVALNRLALPGISQASLEHDREVLRSLQWIGDTPAEQVANEALRRFVAESEAQPRLDVSAVREAAVEEVLLRLREASPRRSQ